MLVPITKWEDYHNDNFSSFFPTILPNPFGIEIRYLYSDIKHT